MDDNGGADRTPRAGRITIRAGAHALPALAIRSFGPRSFTGEDAAELLLPGNPDLLARLVGEWIEAFRADGLRGAQPGEFSARAFLNGRLTPEQAEGVGAVIAARSEAELAAARRVLDGRAGAEHRALADETASLLALVEAGIDFTDQEDVVAIAPEQAYARALAAAGRIDALVGPGAVREAEDALPVVALAGAPNAGKSTLFNALLGRRRAIVSDVPGTTRDALAERLELAPFTGGGPFRAPAVTLVDLAGLDAVLARRGAIDAAAQEAARRAIAGASVIVWCDPAGRFDPRDLPLGLAGRAVIRVRTKGDLPGGGSGRDAGALAVCALDGWGLAALGRAIADAAGREPAGGAEALVLPRHRAALAAARDHLRRAAELVAPDLGSGRLSRAELVADALRAALDELGAIAGRISPDDVIGRIFATFCIGK